MKILPTSSQDKNEKKIVINEWIAYLIIILITSLVFFCFFIFSENRQLSNTIVEINSNIEKLYTLNHSNNSKEINKTILDLQFKDNLVLNQINNYTATMLTLITIIVSIGGIVTFRAFKDNITLINNKVKKHVVKLKSLEQELDNKLIQIDYDLSKNSIISKSTNYINFLTNIKKNKDLLDKKNLTWEKYRKNVSEYNVHLSLHVFNIKLLLKDLEENKYKERMDSETDGPGLLDKKDILKNLNKDINAICNQLRKVNTLNLEQQKEIQQIFTSYFFSKEETKIYIEKEIQEALMPLKNIYL